MSDDPSVSALHDHLGFWLRFVSNHVSHAFARRLAAHDVTVGEWVVLRELLTCGQARPSELAERLGMTRGAITKIADRLEPKRLVSRRPDERDGRSRALRITAKGRALVPVLAAEADANDDELFGVLTPEQRAALCRAMQDLVRIHALRSTPID